MRKIELKSGKIITKNFFMEVNDEVLDEFEYSAEAEEKNWSKNVGYYSYSKDMARVVAIGGNRFCPIFTNYLVL